MKLERSMLPEVPKELRPFVSSLSTHLSTLQAIVNGRLSLGDLELGSGNIDGRPATVADTGSADTEFTVTHSLGRIPIFYLWNISKSGYVYDSQRNLWTTSTLRLKCNAANAALTLFVFG